MTRDIKQEVSAALHDTLKDTSLTVEDIAHALALAGFYIIHIDDVEKK